MNGRRSIATRIREALFGRPPVVPTLPEIRIDAVTADADARICRSLAIKDRAERRVRSVMQERAYLFAPERDLADAADVMAGKVNGHDH